MSRFVLDADSRLVANARSSLHPLAYRAPVSGHIDVSVTNSGFDLTAPVSAAVEVDLEALQGDDAHTNSEMRRRVEVRRYPHARASIDGVTSIGADRYRLVGELSLHGQTRRITGEARVSRDGESLHAAGSMTLDVREFGIKVPSLLMLKVHPEVEVVLDVHATRNDDG